MDRILAEHVIEHWAKSEFCSFLDIVRSFSSEAGFIRIAVPDGFHPDPAYIEHVRPGGGGYGADEHQVLYNHEIMAQLLSQMHYDFRFLEYFDQKGNFHQIGWAASDGLVQRSAKYDPRNRVNPL